uniref:Uncharacterized protein n=1 Tax=Octactis speculum TaxID=3111310 RepID=A0A7S2HLJ6_9STRA
MRPSNSDDDRPPLIWQQRHVAVCDDRLNSAGSSSNASALMTASALVSARHASTPAKSSMPPFAMIGTPDTAAFIPAMAPQSALPVLNPYESPGWIVVGL